MLRDSIRAHALSFALLLAASACAPGARRVPTAPEPAPAPAPEQPVQAPEPLGETFEIEAAAPAAPVSAGLLGSAVYDLPVEANRWVEMEIDFLVNQRRAVIGRWLERGDKWDEWVQDVFASYGIPRDLHHLAMVESGYQATVRSHAGAVGMWQFMPATGRGMGLRIDGTVDERRDPIRATHAAARHLRQLHREFRGDWALAAAAYNAGSGRINRGMARFGVRNFWDLAERGDLAQETRHYVPRLYAMTIIGRDPARFGFPAPQGTRKFAYDSVRVDIPTPLSELARIASRPAAELAELNPHLIQGTAPANYWVWVPAGSGAALQQAFHDSDFRKTGGVGVYALRRGETVADVAQASGLPMERIRDLNLSRNLERMGRGDRLRLPASAVTALNARPTQRVASREADTERSSSSRSSRRASRDTDDDAKERPSSSERRSSTASRDSDSEDGERSSRSTRSARRNAEGEERVASRSTSRSERSSERASGTSERSSSERAERGSSERSEPSASDKASSERSTERASSERTSTERSSTSRRSASAASGEGSERRSAPRSGGSSSSSRSHKVEGGETLWGIARKYEVSVAELRQANDLGEDEAIQPGQALRVPRASSSSGERSERASSTPAREERPSRATETRREGGSSRTARASSSESGQRSGGTASRRSAGATERYTVKSGDTLWSIARQHGTSVDALRSANDMAENQPIQPGQTLVVPKR